MCHCCVCHVHADDHGHGPAVQARRRVSSSRASAAQPSAAGLCLFRIKPTFCPAAFTPAEAQPPHQLMMHIYQAALQPPCWQPHTAAAPSCGRRRPGPGAICSGAVSMRECRCQDDCVWCTAAFGPSTIGNCFDKEAARYLPDQWYECIDSYRGSAAADTDRSTLAAEQPITAAATAEALKAPARQPAVAAPAPVGYPGPPYPGPPAPGASCSVATKEKPCLHQKGCVWCVGSFGPFPTGSCYDKSSAKFLPKQFYKCKGPKKPTKEAAASISGAVAAA